MRSNRSLTSGAISLKHYRRAFYTLLFLSCFFKGSEAAACFSKRRSHFSGFREIRGLQKIEISCKYCSNTGRSLSPGLKSSDIFTRIRRPIKRSYYRKPDRQAVVCRSIRFYPNPDANNPNLNIFAAGSVSGTFLRRPDEKGIGGGSPGKSRRREVPFNVSRSIGLPPAPRQGRLREKSPAGKPADSPKGRSRPKA